jgi:hypothetical protein
MRGLCWKAGLLAVVGAACAAEPAQNAGTATAAGTSATSAVAGTGGSPVVPRSMVVQMQPKPPATTTTTTPPPAAPTTAPNAMAGGAGAPPATNMPVGMTPTTPTTPPAAGMAPQPAAGPEDGDPAQPIVMIPEVACGGPMGGFGLGSANFKMDERDMIVTYPCNKHAGAPVTFILNLHGTTPVEQHFYQHGYFAAHQFAASHNLLIVTPSSVVQQWGNGDDGKDEPHLMNIIDWVYKSFHGEGKFDIRAMWVGGHSWGGGYTARFGCKPELADKVKGLIMMSGGGVGGFGGASCANNVSAIITMAEGDGREPSDQAMLASTHGCGTAMTEMILQNKHTFWPSCMPGFVHANYYMLGKEHATFMDKEVVESIVDWIKLQRQ